MKFNFDPETHTYTLGEKVLPSVTQIIKPLEDFTGIPKDILAKAANWGTAVHEMIRLDIDKEFDITLLGDFSRKSLQPVLGAWYDFVTDRYKSFDDLGDNLVSCEDPNYHKSLKYAGTPDLVTKDAIIDIKTRKPKPFRDSVQIEAYNRMLGGGHAKRKLYVLWLKVDGTYEFQRIKKGQAWSVFRKMLDYYNLGLEIEKFKRLEKE
jgi:hypothetical protein